MVEITIDSGAQHDYWAMIFKRDPESIEQGYEPFAIHEKGGQVDTAKTLRQAIDIAITRARRRKAL